MHTVSRRDFVVVLTATGGGLLLGCRVGDRSGTATAAAAPPPLAFAPNAFIRIGSDGRVTLVMNQVEMGQGTYTSMPMLLAEELEVGLDQVRLEHAPQSAMPQPNFVPVRPTTSRSTQRSGISGGTSTVWSLPLMLRVIMLGLVLRVACSYRM